MRLSPVLCQPELKNCVLGLTYLLRDGRQGLAVVIQDVSGKTMRREVCEFNSSDDLRHCVDWDTGAKHRDAKNAKGDWVNLVIDRLSTKMPRSRPFDDPIKLLGRRDLSVEAYSYRHASGDELRQA